jgi:hypothetical protein
LILLSIPNTPGQPSATQALTGARSASARIYAVSLPATIVVSVGSDIQGKLSRNKVFLLVLDVPPGDVYNSLPQAGVSAAKSLRGLAAAIAIHPQN